MHFAYLLVPLHTMKKSTAILLFCVAISQTQAQTLQDSCIHLNEIIVTGLTGAAHINHVPAPVSVVSQEELQHTASTNIIDAISRQPGLSQLSTGAGIAKPVIRGLGYNRVLVVNDGLRQEGQQWGDEHGVEIDGENVHNVEVQKGPASLMYGSDAMAGVIIMHDAPILPQSTMKGNVSAQYQTNSNLWGYSGNFAGHQQKWVWNCRWTQKHAGEYSNPQNHSVHNSQFAEQALNAMFGINSDWGFSHLKLSWFHQKPGIVEDEDESPFQQIHHLKAAIDNAFRLGEGQFKAIVGYQQNKRQEFNFEECGLDFRLHTLSYDFRYVSPEWNGWLANIGANGMWQRSQNQGNEFLIPAYRLFDIGLFTTISKDLFQRLHVSGGLRFDRRTLHAYELKEEGEIRFNDFHRHFNGATGSFGAIWNMSSNCNLRLNIARGFRAPNLSELGSNGEHEGTLRYERGNHDLKPEYSWQGDFGIDFNIQSFAAKLAFFANRVNHFIFLEKNGDIEQGKPVYTYKQGDARLLGFEATIILHPLQHLHFENAFSYVDAQQLHQPEDAKYLPFTPAPRWLSTLHYDLKGSSRIVSNLFVEAVMDCNLEQNHIHSANNTETRTPSYTLWNAATGCDLMSKGKKVCTLHLSVQNIFNRAYQNHLSRLKEAGIYNMGRNVVLKMNVPIRFT